MLPTDQDPPTKYSLRPFRSSGINSISCVPFVPFLSHTSRIKRLSAIRMRRAWVGRLARGHAVPPDLTEHDVRAYAVTRDIRAVQELLGHSSPDDCATSSGEGRRAPDRNLLSGCQPLEGTS
jgi:integrase